MTDTPLAPGTHPRIWQEMVDYLFIFKSENQLNPRTLVFEIESHLRRHPARKGSKSCSAYYVCLFIHFYFIICSAMP